MIKYMVHYWIDGFGGQKEYFETYEAAEEFVNKKITKYAEDITITKIEEDKENE